MIETEKWHCLPANKVMEKLDTSEKGLKREEAGKRLEKYGKNEIEEAKKISPIKIFISQFTSPLVIILIVAAVISYAIGFIPGQEPRTLDTILILIIVIANGIFGFVQDYKAEKSIEALKRLSAPKARVLRDGKEEEIESKELVPGDIIILSEGDKISADARLLEVSELHVDESILTGESVPVHKVTEIMKENLIIADRKNMVYTNTTVTMGTAKAVVVSTAMSTEIGKIAKEIKETEEKETPFHQEVDALGKKLGILILIIIVAVAAIQILVHSADMIDILLISVSLAVAAIPEGLPAIVTLTLALGTRQMLKRNALVRKLSVVESLGSVNVICSDKTGTITEGRMTTKRIYVYDEYIDVTGTGYKPIGEFLKDGKKIDTKNIEEILLSGQLCNNAKLGKKEGKTDYIGDPTEIAFLVAAQKARIKSENYRRVFEIPFSSEKKRMTVACKKGNKTEAYMKGAPEIVLKRCNRIMIKGKVKKMTPKQRKLILEKNKEMAGNALRVLAFAKKDLKSKNKAAAENGLIFLGLQGLFDPPRKETKDAVETCKKAGIRVIMITGDHMLTAQAVGKEIGLGQKAMEGKYLEKLDEKKLRKIVEEYDIFARVSPEHKVRILKALQKKGYTVAMTGDGVNDAPALKNSDVGIAMGEKGTDIARETADMVLLDDNFATIKESIKEGRRIFDNIQKFVNYLLSSNIAEILVIFIASLFGYLALTAVMLLWINLLTDGFPALALGIDKAAPGIMERKPRNKKEGILSRRLIYQIGIAGSVLTFTLLIVFYLGLPMGLATAQTMVFTGFVLFEFIRIAAIRRAEKVSFFSNKWLLLALAVCIILQLLVVYSPLNVFFGTVPLGLYSWEVLIAGAFICWILWMGIMKVLTE